MLAINFRLIQIQLCTKISRKLYSPCAWRAGRKTLLKITDDEANLLVVHFCFSHPILPQHVSKAHLIAAFLLVALGFNSANVIGDFVRWSFVFVGSFPRCLRLLKLINLQCVDSGNNYGNLFRNVSMYVSISRRRIVIKTVSPQFRCAEPESEIRFSKFDPGRSREASEICGFLLFFG
jgi:hypothetical protein